MLGRHGRHSLGGDCWLCSSCSPCCLASSKTRVELRQRRCSRLRLSCRVWCDRLSNCCLWHPTEARCYQGRLASAAGCCKSWREAWGRARAGRRCGAGARVGAAAQLRPCCCVCIAALAIHAVSKSAEQVEMLSQRWAGPVWAVHALSLALEFAASSPPSGFALRSSVHRRRAGPAGCRADGARLSPELRGAPDGRSGPASQTAERSDAGKPTVSVNRACRKEPQRRQSGGRLRAGAEHELNRAACVLQPAELNIDLTLPSSGCRHASTCVEAIRGLSCTCETSPSAASLAPVDAAR